MAVPSRSPTVRPARRRGGRRDRTSGADESTVPVIRAPAGSLVSRTVTSDDTAATKGNADAVPATRFNLALTFETVAATVPDRECLVWGERRLTYRTMAERSRRLASYLADQGLGSHTERSELRGHQSGQDHLALALYNGNEYLEGMIGSYRARVAPYNVNYRYVGEELHYLLRDAGTRAIVYHASLAPTLADVLPDLPPVSVLLHVPDESGNDPLPGAVPYEDALAMGSPDGPDVTPSPDDLYVLYTGGTTGMPKGVLWRQHDIFVAAMGGRRVGTWEMVRSYPDLASQAAAGLGLKLGLLPPLMHGAAQWAAFMLMADGATIVLPDDPRRLDPADVWRTVEREGINAISIVGDAVLRPLLDELDRAAYDTSSLMAVGNGGAPLTPAVRQMIRQRLPSVLVSDSVGILGDRSPDAHGLDRRRRCGTVLPRAGHGRGLRIPRQGAGTGPRRDRLARPVRRGAARLPARRGEDGPHLPRGRGASLLDPGRPGPAPGRWRDRAARPGLGHRQLWWGEIFAEEVERAVAGHPAVVDVVVAGRPSERWGQEVVAVVQLGEGRRATAEEIVDHAAGHVARYKLPKAVVFVPVVQRSPSGKADYRWARARAEQADQTNQTDQTDQTER